MGALTSRAPAMRAFLDTAVQVAAVDSALLLTGETGAGKEFLARAIALASARAAAPFVALNCAAVPETLLESELFGHEAGAFTGAARVRRGYFEQAHGGVLFLDEIGDMALPLQAKLLRALEERTVRRLGSERPVPVDVRVMAATHRDLGALVERGAFRADLYYRLAVITLHVPALRERAEDVPELAEAFALRAARQAGRGPVRLAPELIEALSRYPFPGNVRELANLMERAVAFSRGDLLRLEDAFPAAARARVAPSMGRSDRTPPGMAPGSDAPDERPLPPLAQARRSAVAAFERGYLEALLARHRGRIGAAAAAAGITPRMLHKLMVRSGLTRRDYLGTPVATAGGTPSTKEKTT